MTCIPDCFHEVLFGRFHIDTDQALSSLFIVIQMLCFIEFRASGSKSKAGRIAAIHVTENPRMIGFEAISTLGSS
jgi:hypothetical protein